MGGGGASLRPRDGGGAETATDRDIAGQITRCALARQGLVPTADPGLPDVPLEEMLAAIRRVHNAPLERDADGTTIPMLCDPRLVAALYVLDAYEPDSEPVTWCLEQGKRDLGRGLFVARLKLDNEEGKP